MAHKAYGADHRARRKALINQMLDEHTRTGRWWACPHCGHSMALDPLLPHHGLDLGHSDSARKQQGLPGDALWHSTCNRSFGDGTRVKDWTSVDW